MKSINDMDKYFLSTLKAENVHWEHGSFVNQKCSAEECPEQVMHCCFSDYSADAEPVKSLCNSHYKPDTQKKWLKRFKAKLIN